ncbi:hypothetical protein BT93_L0068 [Corymbia citriodora subsp. variegata]|uniref:Glutathione S-transferase n=1 Tax=Corymbia citriodora subsp. variegata TaxID=360336 RepID=A0A8T0CFT3_CORYI|nr:hypothetical protein BT93_L0068 [Corymbia citriodora subsp. variegata]
MNTEAQEQPKVTLYWLDQSRSQRIVWLLEEAKIKYDIEVFKRTPERLAPPSLKKVHPLGKAPVLSIESPGAAAPYVLAESGFIVEYIAEHFAPHLIPARYAPGKQGPGLETESWMRYRFYMHYAEGILTGPRIPFFLRPVTRAIVSQVEAAYFKPNYDTQFPFLESQLVSSPEGGKFLCGSELSAADILMSFPLSAAKAAGYFTKEKCPKLWAYVEMIEGMEGQKKAIAKIEEVTGEPYQEFSA